MKYIIIILLVFMGLLPACKKADKYSSTNPTITYRYTTNVSNTYIMEYTNAIGGQDTVKVTGATWSTTFTTSKSQGFTYAEVSLIENSSPGPAVQGNIEIDVNGVSKASAPINIQTNGDGGNVLINYYVFQ